MSESFSVPLADLEYGTFARRRERVIAFWREALRRGGSYAPVKVRTNSNGRLIVVSGEELIEAARLEGRAEIECVRG
jgi:hypothetical protein